MDNGYILLSKGNRSAALSSREACKAMPSGREGLSALWELGTARSKQGTGGNGRGQCVRRLQGELRAWEGQCAGAVDTKSGELTCSQRAVV